MILPVFCFKFHYNSCGLYSLFLEICKLLSWCNFYILYYELESVSSPVLKNVVGCVLNDLLDGVYLPDLLDGVYLRCFTK